MKRYTHTSLLQEFFLALFLTFASKERNQVPLCSARLPFPPQATPRRAMCPCSVVVLSGISTRCWVEAGGGGQEAGARALLLGFGSASFGAIVVKSARGQVWRTGGGLFLQSEMAVKCGN